MKLFYVFLFAGLLLGSCQVDLEGLPADAAASTAESTAAKDDREDTSQTEEETSTETISCETLFARGNDEESTCFLMDGFSRWGWTIGPLQEGDYSFSLYAGAGQCDTEKGTLVGFLEMTYDGGKVSVSVQMLDGFSLSETHLYIGKEPYPADKNGNDTVAPGQFPYKHDLDAATSDYFEVEGLSGDIYMIFHGVSCSADNSGEGDESTDGEGGSTEGGTDGGSGDGSGDGTGDGTDDNNTNTGDYVPS